MLTTHHQTQQPASHPPTRPLALVVELDPSDRSAVVRVLTLLARRRCSLTHATFAPDPKTGCDVLHLELDAPRHLRDNVVQWISALVPVRSVSTRPDGRTRGTPPSQEGYAESRRKRLAASA